MTPYWQSKCGRYTLYHGDCIEILPTLAAGSIDAVVTDPPYGIGAASMTLGNGRKRFDRCGGSWDNARPDISAVVGFADTVIVWGGNYFSDVLPPTNDWLIWDKAQPDTVSFSGAEMAWTNLGRNARVKRHHWSGENKEHPTMKPVPVMVWCLGFLPEGVMVLDPYCGSGSTGVACVKTNRRFIGIEIHERYLEISAKRIEREADHLFAEVQP